MAAHSRHGAVARDEQIACLGSTAREMRHDASTIPRYVLGRTAGKNNSIRDSSPQSLIDARPNPGSPGSFDPIKYRATPVKLQKPIARHANRGIHFGAGSTHYGEQFARKAKA